MKKLEKIIGIDANTETKFFKKKDFVQKQGEKNALAYYVKKGLLRSYTIDEKGKEHIFMFASEGWLIADIDSQEFDQATELFIDCIEDAELVAFDRKAYLLENFSTDYITETANLLARRVAVLQRRVILLMSASAKKRYQNFLETYPELPNRVPQRMIASYLGITPEALSKIRGEIAKSK